MPFPHYHRPYIPQRPHYPQPYVPPPPPPPTQWWPSRPSGEPGHGGPTGAIPVLVFLLVLAALAVGLFFFCLSSCVVMWVWQKPFDQEWQRQQEIEQQHLSSHPPARGFIPVEEPEPANFPGH